MRWSTRSLIQWSATTRKRWYPRGLHKMCLNALGVEIGEIWSDQTRDVNMPLSKYEIDVTPNQFALLQLKRVVRFELNGLESVGKRN